MDDIKRSASKPPTATEREKRFKLYPIQLAGYLLLGKRYWCTWCGNEVLGFKDRLSATEFRQTGACQSCQDKTFEAAPKNRRRATQYDLPIT
jgi:hypothetical protein